MDSVASIPKWAAATTGSAVGLATAAARAHTSAAPQAASPSADAARKLNGTDGGGIPSWPAATTGSAVGLAAAAARAHTSAAPQAASPSADAARKLNGTDGGGTPAGTPAGRPAHDPAAGDGGRTDACGTSAGIVSPDWPFLPRSGSALLRAE